MNADVIRFLRDLFESSGLNRLPAEFGGHRIFREPTIGVTAGNDPIIARFKDVVSRAHHTPAEMWSRSAGGKSGVGEAGSIGRPGPDAGTWSDLDELASKLRVLSVVFPYTRVLIEDGLRSSKRTPMTGLALNRAHVFHTEVFEKTAGFFVERGHRVMVPQKSRFHSVLLRVSRPRIVSAWSERHYAFAAGLGTFGLAEHLITEFGCNVRLGSFITDAPLAVTPRVSDDPFANCLHFSRGGCAKCASRCPGRALTETGHNKIWCEYFRHKAAAGVHEEIAPFLKPITRRFLRIPVTDYPIGCGVCQYDVPCMDRNPMADERKEVPI